MYTRARRGPLERGVGGGWGVGPPARRPTAPPAAVLPQPAPPPGSPSEPLSGPLSGHLVVRQADPPEAGDGRLAALPSPLSRYAEAAELFLQIPLDLVSRPVRLVLGLHPVGKQGHALAQKLERPHPRAVLHIRRQG